VPDPRDDSLAKADPEVLVVVPVRQGFASQEHMVVVEREQVIHGASLGSFRSVRSAPSLGLWIVITERGVWTPNDPPRDRPILLLTD
jgi:hypothetical protein